MNMLSWKRKLWASLAVVALLLGAGGSAVAPLLVGPATAQVTGTSFSRIVVKGNQRIETATIRDFAAIKAGQPVTPGQIDAAYRKLIATGLFEKVTLTPRGRSLIIAVREYPTINRINFERNKRIKDKALAKVISSKPRHTYSPAQAKADAAAIVAAYRQAGRFSAQVTPKIIRRSDNRVDLVFEIFEGKVIEIKRIGFVGNRHFSDRRLRRVLGTKQAGLLHAFIKSDTYVADRIQFDKQVLRDFYHSRGFIDFQVLSVSAEVAKSRNGFFLTFKLQEGQPYTFGKITTTSDLSEIDPDQYKKVIRIKPGMTYGPNLVDSTITTMERLATRKGLNFIRVTPRVTRHDATRTLDIAFVIEKGPRQFVERIDIEGNTTTLDRVIRRQFRTVEGDPFNPHEIRMAAERIRALGFFSKSDVKTRPGTNPDQVIVDVNVKDQPTGSLAFGVSYGASTGIGGTISLSERNFLGRGQFIKIQAGGTGSNRNTELAFTEPAFLGRNLRLGLSAYRRTTTKQNASYDTTVAGFEPKISFPTGQNGRMELSYRRVSNTLNGITGTASPIITADAGTRQAGVLGIGYTYDTRTSGLNPKAGVILHLNSEAAGLGGTARFLRTTALVGARTAILNDEVSLSIEMEGGFLKASSGSSNIADRFFMGERVMRGYALRGIGPRDMTAGLNHDALGGTMFAVARMEANFPLGLPDEYGISGGAFLDVGSLWGVDNLRGQTANDATGVAGTTASLRSVLGFSIFWKTAVGPLRFNFTKVLSGPSYDRPESFSLTIGTRF